MRDEVSLLLSKIMRDEVSLLLTKIMRDEVSLLLSKIMSDKYAAGKGHTPIGKHKREQEDLNNVILHQWISLYLCLSTPEALNTVVHPILSSLASVVYSHPAR